MRKSSSIASPSTKLLDSRKVGTPSPSLASPSPSPVVSSDKGSLSSLPGPSGSDASDSEASGSSRRAKLAALGCKPLPEVVAQTPSGTIMKWEELFEVSLIHMIFECSLYDTIMQCDNLS